MTFLHVSRTDPYLWYRRAQIAIAENEPDTAESHLAKVKELDSNGDFEVQDLQIQIAWLRGDTETAQSLAQAYSAELNPGQMQAYQHELALLISEHPDKDGGNALPGIFKAADN